MCDNFSIAQPQGPQEIGMELEDILKDLEDAKSRKKDWREIGRILVEVQQSGRWRDEYQSPTAWLAAVADTTRFSKGFLHRFRTVYEFIERWQEDRPETELLENGSHFSFASGELIKRLHDIDPAKADELLLEISKRKVPYHEVKTAYEHAAGISKPKKEPKASFGGVVNYGPGKAKNLSASKFVIRQSRAFSERAYQAVEANRDRLTGRGDIEVFYRDYKFDFATPHAVAIALANFGIKFVDGFDFRNIASSLPRGQRNQLLGEIALSSTFFRRYWLVLPEKGSIAASIAEDLQNLDLHSIGVATLSEDSPGELTIIAKPHGIPVPDRQEIGRGETLKQGIPN
jgi:hypothetical protein